PEGPQIDLDGPTVRARPLDRTLRSAPPSGAGPRSPRAGRAARDGVRWSCARSTPALEQDPPHQGQDRPDLPVRLAHGPPPLARYLAGADLVTRPSIGACPRVFTRITESGVGSAASPGSSSTVPPPPCAVPAAGAESSVFPRWSARPERTLCARIGRTPHRR